MAPVLVLAHAPHAEGIAHRVKDKLSGLGYAVAPGASATPRGQAARIEAADKVVLLWSRAARGTPALRAAVRRARTKGTLVCVSLDAAPPPTGAHRVTRLPRSDAAWRKLLGARKAAVQTAAPARAQPRPAKARRDASLRVPPAAAPASKRRAGLPMLALALALMGAAMTELYAQDTAFAAQVDALASQARTTAAQMAAKLGG